MVEKWEYIREVRSLLFFAFFSPSFFIEREKEGESCVLVTHNEL